MAAVEAGDASLAVEVVRDEHVVVQYRHVEGEHDEPEQGRRDNRIALRATRHRAEWMHHSQVAVERHQHERVDAHVRRHVQQVLVALARDAAERPDAQAVGDRREGDAHDDEEEVGDGKIDDEDVGRVAHLLVRHHHDDDEQVADDADHRDDAEDGRHDDADDVFELRVVSRHVVRRVHRLPL